MYTSKFNFLVILFAFIILIISPILYGHLSIDYSFLLMSFFIIVLCSTYYYFSFRGLINTENFIKKIFWISFVIRVIAVFVYYLVFYNVTNTPFEITFSDSLYYDEIGQKIAHEIRTFRMNFVWLFSKKSADDTGYGFFLGGLYVLFNDSIIITRIIQAGLSAYTVVLSYKISKTIWNENIGRYTAILFSGFHTFILYSSLHLREFLMVFIMFFLFYNFIKYKESFSLKRLILIIIAVISLLFLRTVVVVVFIASVSIYTIIFQTKSIRRIIFSLLILFGFFMILFYVPFFDSSAIKFLGYVGINDNVRLGGYSEERVLGTGMTFVKYVVGPIAFIPSLIFPIPSLLKLSLEQFNQSMHWYFTGGLIIWIFLSTFYIKGIIQSIKDKNKNALFLIIFILLYSAVLIKSHYFSSIRFNQLKMPLVLLFAAYGMTILKNKKINYILIFTLLSIIILGYNYLRITGREI